MAELSVVQMSNIRGKKLTKKLIRKKKSKTKKGMPTVERIKFIRRNTLNVYTFK